MDPITPTTTYISGTVQLVSASGADVAYLAYQGVLVALAVVVFGLGAVLAVHVLGGGFR